MQVWDFRGEDTSQGSFARGYPASDRRPTSAHPIRGLPDDCCRTAPVHPGGRQVHQARWNVSRTMLRRILCRISMPPFLSSCWWKPEILGPCWLRLLVCTTMHGWRELASVRRSWDSFATFVLYNLKINLICLSTPQPGPFTAVPQASAAFSIFCPFTDFHSIKTPPIKARPDKATATYQVYVTAPL